MRTTAAAVKVGVTAIVIAILAFMAFRFVAKGIRGKDGFHVYALFRDATGLVEKSRVQIAGLSIGEISDRRLEAGQARVTVKIQQQAVLYRNATVFKKAASLLGEYYLEIDPGTPESPDPKTGEMAPNAVLKDGDRIVNVVESVSPSDVLVQINETIPVLRDILRDVQKMTQGPIQDVVKSVQTGIDKNSEAVNQLLTHMDEITQDVRGLTGGQAREDIRKSIENVRDITEGMRSLIGKGEGEVSQTGEKIRSNLDKISIAIENLNHTMENVAATSDKINRGEGTVGRLLHDETIANNIENVTENVGSLVGGITRLQTLVGLRSEYNVLAGTLKTYVGVQLQSRPDKFFLVEFIDDPRGSRSRETTFSTTDDPSKPLTTKTDTVRVSSGFRFSIQLAKRFFLLGGKMQITGRFGIKESSGGIGLDFDFPLSIARSWFRTLSLKADLFEFRNNVYPRLKILAAVEFFKHLWIVGGVDDVINGSGLGPGVGGYTGRDYFIGAQLTFTDDDLRSLLIIGGSALAGAGGK